MTQCPTVTLNHIPANMRHRLSSSIMLGQHCRRWTTIKPVLIIGKMFAGLLCSNTSAANRFVLFVTLIKGVSLTISVLRGITILSYIKRGIQNKFFLHNSIYQLLHTCVFEFWSHLKDCYFSMVFIQSSLFTSGYRWLTACRTPLNNWMLVYSCGTLYIVCLTLRKNY